MDLRTLLASTKVVGLSPMDGITDEPFRLIQTRTSKPDLTFTEFVSAEGISRGGIKLYDMLLYKPEERPIVGQLFGKDPDSFYQAAFILCELGFDGVDINMGCPAKTVTQNGSGAALIGQPQLASAIIKAVQSAVTDWTGQKRKITDLGLKPKLLSVIAKNRRYSKVTTRPNPAPTISVKTRTGINEPVIGDWIPHLLAHNLDFITLHGRTLKQGYAGTADWELISQAAEMSHRADTFIFGNGDVHTRSQAYEYMDKYNVDGILIGRAAMGNPWVFSDYQANPEEKFRSMLLHAQISQEIFPQRRFDSLRKHFLLYASGLPNAKHLRSKLVALNSLADIESLESEFCGY